jgi:hypothetical protein
MSASFQFDRYLLHFDPYIFKKNLICNGYTSTSTSPKIAGHLFVRLKTRGDAVYMNALNFTDILDPSKRDEYWNKYRTKRDTTFDLYNADSTSYIQSPRTSGSIRRTRPTSIAKGNGTMIRESNGRPPSPPSVTTREITTRRASLILLLKII